jgi:SET domain-containing protein
MTRPASFRAPLTWEAKASLALLALLLVAVAVHRAAERLEGTPARIETLDDPVEVRPSLIPGAGLGLFARRDLAAGERLGGYDGALIDQRELESLRRRGEWQYVFILHECSFPHVKERRWLDGRRGSRFSRMNYAPWQRQNVEFVNTCQAPYVAVQAIRNIREGEELYVDYGPRYDYSFMELPEVKRYFGLPPGRYDRLAPY